METKKTNISVAEDVFWYLKRYKNVRDYRTYDDVFLHWKDVLMTVPEAQRNEKIFEIERGPIEKFHAVSVKREVRKWIVAYSIDCHFKKVDDAVYNLIGWVQKIEGEW
jgi:hypothetical protein